MTDTHDCCNPPETESIGSALARIAQDPWTVFVRQWNWKAAVLSGAIRGLPYTVVLLGHPGDAGRGAEIEMCFRILSGGCWGSLIQALRRARPAWAAGIAIALGIPASSQLLEYAVLKIGGATHIKSAMVLSAIFGGGSAVINFGLMRRGLLLTGDGAASFGSDLRRVPGALRDWGRAVRRTMMERT